MPNDGDLVRVVGVDADRLSSYLESRLPRLAVVSERSWTVERTPAGEDCIVATDTWRSVLDSLADREDRPPVVVIAPEEATVEAALEAGAADVVRTTGGSTATLLARRIETIIESQPPRADRTLTALYSAIHRLFGATDKREIASIVTDASTDALAFDGAGVRLYDPENGTLVNVAFGGKPADDIEERPTFDIEDSPHGEAFRTGETVEYDVPDEGEPYDLDPFERVLYVPLGEHGVLSVGIGDCGTFDERDRQYVDILSRSARAAMTSTEREQILRDEKERLETFATVISHDFRNPLQVARARVELAQGECDSSHLERVVAAHDRMETLVDNVLALAQNERIVADTDIDLAAAVREGWSFLDAEDATLIVESDPETVAASSGHVRQLCQNLFRNAVEHAGEDVTVWVGALEEGFYVADDGPGIDIGDKTRVFEGGYTTREDGVGFGLTIVERIADAHDWSVSVTESHEGGARFEFRTE